MSWGSWKTSRAVSVNLLPGYPYTHTHAQVCLLRKPVISNEQDNSKLTITSLTVMWMDFHPILYDDLFQVSLCSMYSSISGAFRRTS